MWMEPREKGSACRLWVPMLEVSSGREARKVRRSKGTFSCSSALGKSAELIQMGKIRNVD